MASDAGQVHWRAEAPNDETRHTQETRGMSREKFAISSLAPALYDAATMLMKTTRVDRFMANPK